MTRVCPACGTPRSGWSSQCRSCGLSFDELALAEVGEAASRGPGPLARLLLRRLRYLLPLLILGVVVIVPLMFMAASRSSAPDAVPQVGKMWFGSTTSDETFELEQSSPVRVGDKIALVAHLSREVAAGDRLTMSKGGVLIADEAVDSFGGRGQILYLILAPTQVPASYAPGSYAAAVKDAAGNVLAIGTLTVTP